MRVGASAIALCCLSCRSEASTSSLPPPDASVRARLSASAAPARPAPACPSEMIAFESFCIDRWEATLVELESGRAHSPFERPKPRVGYRAVSKSGVLPQGYLSRIEASAACERAGKRLCAAREWFSACSGSERERCNTGKPHVLTQLFGKHVTLTYDAHYNNPRVNREPGFLAKTGEHSGCTSGAGAFDMIGNLHEWVADDVSSKLSKEVPLEYGQHKLGAKGSGVFMGGYYSSKSEHGRGCAYITATHAPDYHDYSTGFRCCAAQNH